MKFGNVVNTIFDDLKSNISDKLDENQTMRKLPTVDLHRVCADINLNRFVKRDVEKESKIYEDIAKLSVDLYFDFDYYRKYALKRDYMNEILENKLKELGFKVGNGYWEIDTKPQKELVVDNIFIYCYYKTILEKLANNQDSGMRSTVLKEDEYKSMTETKSIIEKEENRREEKCKKCNGKVYKDGLCRDCMKNGDSWTCKYENCANKNIDPMHCKMCGIEKGSSGIYDKMVSQMLNYRIRKVWVCSKCHIVNDEDRSKECKTCRVSRSTRNSGYIDPISKPKDDRQPELESEFNRERKWSCDVCHLLNDPKLRACHSCTKLKEGVWTCSWCTAINKESMDNCTVCEHKKGDEPPNYCTNCQLKEKFQDELCHDCFKSRGQGWDCWYDKCKSRNERKDEFCKKCGLDRKGKQSDGFVWLQTKTGEKEQVWICKNCVSINSISNFDCDSCKRNRILF